MSLSHIKTFEHNEKVYHHYINTNTDAVSLFDENKEILLTYYNDASAITPSGAHYGRFSYKNYPNWSWQGADGNDIQQFGKDLLAAEVEVSKMFIDESNYVPEA